MTWDHFDGEGDLERLGWQQGDEEARRVEDERTASEARIRELLADVYRPDGVDLWLRAPNKLLRGERPCDLIERGETQPVLDVIDMLRTGAFS